MAMVCSDSEWGEEVEDPVAYLTAACGICNAVLIYCSASQSIASLAERDVIDLEGTSLVYPTLERLHRSVPETISALYSDAYKIKRTAPDTFVTQIRRALEAVCKDRGTRRGDLKTRLCELFSKGELPKVLFEAADEIRDLGNKTTHDPDQRIKTWQANTIDEYFRAVIEHVYVLPFKVQAFRDSLNRLRAKNAKEQTESIH